MKSIQNIDDWVFPHLKFMRELIQELQQENQSLKEELMFKGNMQSSNKSKIVQLKISR